MISILKIKQLKSLHKKKYRRIEQKFLLEGYRLIDQALSKNAKIEKIWITKKSENSLNWKNLYNLINKKNIPWDILPDKILKQISDSLNNQGIIALSPIPKFKKYIQPPKKSIFLDKISDPGNMGTILRTAAWFGIKSIFCSPNCVDTFNSKVVRSAMGAHFYFSHLCFIKDELFLEKLKKYEIEILGTGLSGQSILNLNISNLNSWCLVLGNEAHGISKEIQKTLTTTITIPRIKEIESLNVSVAGGILLYTLCS